MGKRKRVERFEDLIGSVARVIRGCSQNDPIHVRTGYQRLSHNSAATPPSLRHFPSTLWRRAIGPSLDGLDSPSAHEQGEFCDSLIKVRPTERAINFVKDKSFDRVCLRRASSDPRHTRSKLPHSKGRARVREGRLNRKKHAGIILRH